MNMRVMMTCAVWSLVALAVALSAAANESAGEPDNLADLSIEELMDIEVTSVSKKEESFFKAPAAVYVITQEDIRRSGARHIPDVLRMAPGIEVAQIDSHTWAITSRGFNGEFANKLLVMIDGRSVYTPLFGGVYWDLQDVLLDDVDRIEIIRGPGATLWGANAVNGIINIITKSADDTQGMLLQGGAGTEELGFGAARYGGKLGDDFYYRVYAKYADRDNSVEAPGHSDEHGEEHDAADDWDSLMGGFRVDWYATDNDTLIVHADVVSIDAGQSIALSTLAPPFEDTVMDERNVTAGHVLARWDHVISQTSSMMLQTFYDNSKNREKTFDEDRETADIEFQHRFMMGSRNELTWGLGYRISVDDFDGTFVFSMDPDHRSHDLFSAFIQDDIEVIEDRLHVILGTKYEHNDYTGAEVQPSLRVLVTPNEQNTVWASVSRAVRSPTRFSRDSRLSLAAFPDAGGTTNLMVLLGDDDFESEEVLAHELGYRVQPTDELLLDFAAFYNIYDNLQTLKPATPFFEMDPAPPHLVIPFVLDNKMDGKTYGGEVSATWNATDFLKLSGGYSFLKMDLDPDSSSLDAGADETEDNSPHNQFHLRSYLNLPCNLELDAALYYVDNIPTSDVSSYTRLDARLGWHPTDSLAVTLGLQNLLDKEHTEFGMFEGRHPTEIERSVYGMLTWQF